MKRRRFNPLTVVVTVLAVALVLFASVLQNGGEAPNGPSGLVQDATPLGSRGVDLLFNRLGYQTKRQTEALGAMPRDARVWMLLSPDTNFSQSEANALLKWVQNGGTLVMIASKFESGPRFSLETRLGFNYAQPASLNYGGRSLPQLVPYSFEAVSPYRAGVQNASGSNAKFEAPDRPFVSVAGASGGEILLLPYGKGRVIALPDAWLFSNYALVRGDNATMIANFVRVHFPARAPGAIYFDERAGENVVSDAPLTLAQRLLRPPYVWATLQLLLAALLLTFAAGRRLGAPVPLPRGGPVTRASQFAGAMGALMQRARRPEAAARIVGHAFRRRLAHRLGLSPEDPDAVLAARAHEIAGIPIEPLDRLLLQSRAPQGSETQLARDAAEMERVLRRLDGEL